MIKSQNRAFTLIELSIVLVVIGFIVGGVLVGRDLIDSANVRAQITQIEKFNQAINTFRAKYGELPGDMSMGTATKFSFAARIGYAGEGDGNGIIEGVWGGGGTTVGANHQLGDSQAAGETVMLWVDLSKAGLIDGRFVDATINDPENVNPTGAPTSPPFVNQYLPYAKIDPTAYVAVYSNNAQNYYLIDEITFIGHAGNAYNNVPPFTVKNAYKMDTKIDDGYPEEGNVIAFFLSNVTLTWMEFDGGPTDTSTATPPSTSSCYDDRSVTGSKRLYSITTNKGTGNK